MNRSNGMVTVSIDSVSELKIQDKLNNYFLNVKKGQNKKKKSNHLKVKM